MYKNEMGNFYQKAEEKLQYPKYSILPAQMCLRRQANDSPSPTNVVCLWPQTNK